MAYLEISVGSLSAIINASDANATRVLQAFLKEYRIDTSALTPPQQLDKVVSLTANWISGVAHANETREAVAAARANSASNPARFG